MKKLLATTTMFASIIGTSNSAFAQNADFETRLKALETKYETSSTQIPEPLMKAFKTAKITGRLHIDSRFYDENNAQGDTKQDGIDISGARLGIAGKLSDSFSYKFENDFAKNGSKIKDAYIAYDGIANTQLKIGQFKQFFSLEELTSSNDVSFLDKSAAISAVPSRTVGFGAQTHGENWQIGAGIFGESTGNESRKDDSKYSASIRTSIAPINSDGNLVHLGIAAATSSSDRNDNTLTPESIDKRNLYGAELALGIQSLSLQGEYIINDTTYDKDTVGVRNGTSSIYESYYAQISYVLTGESRIYDAKSGTFKSVKVKNFVDNGGIGAWELLMRISENDSNDDDKGVALNDGKTKEMSFGINWYLNNNARLMANYVTSTTDARTNTNKEFDAFLVRAQFNF